MSQCYWKLEGRSSSYTVVENSVQLHSTFLWEAELMRDDELGYLAEEISLQSGSVIIVSCL